MRVCKNCRKELEEGTESYFVRGGKICKRCDLMMRSCDRCVLLKQEMTTRGTEVFCIKRRNTWNIRITNEASQLLYKKKLTTALDCVYFKDQHGKRRIKKVMSPRDRQAKVKALLDNQEKLKVIITNIEQQLEDKDLVHCGEILNELKECVVEI